MSNIQSQSLSLPLQATSATSGNKPSTCIAHLGSLGLKHEKVGPFASFCFIVHTRRIVLRSHAPTVDLRNKFLKCNSYAIHMQLICLVPSEFEALADANAANRKTLLALGMFSNGGLTCSFAAANAFAWAPE